MAYGHAVDWPVPGLQGPGPDRLPSLCVDPRTPSLTIAEADFVPCSFLAGGQFSLLQTRDAKQIEISYSTLADPQLVSDFTPLMPNRTSQRTIALPHCS